MDFNKPSIRYKALLKNNYMITTAVENSVKIQKFNRKMQNRNRATKDLTKARGRIM